jgi:DNA-directed RNA polymerase subunit RPC12/RpoP
MPYICDECGKPTKNASYYHDFMPPDFVEKYGDKVTHTCDQCRDKAERVREWQNEQFQGNEIICPWCGYKNRDSWEQEDSDDEYECPDCGKVFELEVEHEVSYTTRKPEDKYSETEDNT